MMPFFFLALSFLLDGILTNFLPSFRENLSLLTPFLTIVCLFLLVPFFRKEKSKKYDLYMILLGVFYDVFYTNLLGVHAVFFFLLGFVSRKIWSRFEVNIWTIPLFISIIIAIYHMLMVGCLYLFHLYFPTWNQFLYLLGHSLLLNIFYGELLYVLFYHYNKRYRKLYS